MAKKYQKVLVFHLHVRYVDDNDKLYFRDYLMEHFEIAKEYEKLKLALWKKYEYDRELRKTEFAKKVGISANTLAKLSRNETVSMDIIVRICR